jgi:RNA polymerase sigma factor (sigma-70 family)
MSTSASNAELESEEMESGARIRTAIEEQHEPVLRSIAVLVAKTEPGRRWAEILEIASEVLSESVHEALAHAGSFDPTRSVAAWVRGIAARLLSTRRREEARARRCVPAATLGEEAWVFALEQHFTEPTDAAVASRLDLERAMSRISPEARRVIDLRYYRGLDGKELAAALGVSTSGAARVRVCRALQALRSQFSAAEQEVLP